MRVPFEMPSADGRNFDVLGVGENSVDLLAVLNEFPLSGSKHPLERLDRLPGGQTATALVAAQRLGCRTRYVGIFGDDDLGRLSRESLEREGVDVAAARTVDGAPNRYAVILVDRRSGERTVLWNRHPRLELTA